MMETILVGVGSWIGGILTILITRYLRRDNVTEGLAQMDAAVTVKKRMRDEGFTEAEIASVMRTATRRSLALEKAVEQAEEDDFAEFNEAKSQSEMTAAARRRLEKLDLEMRHELDRLEWVLEGEQLERLVKAQEAWAEYRKQSGDFYSFMQGTMWPMVGAMTMSKITKRRLEDLRSDRDTLQGPA